MNNIFTPESFFDLSHCSFSDLFAGKQYVWDVLKILPDYIEEQFSSGKLIANYKDSKNIFVGEGTIIEEGAFIKGPAIIGKNCFIGHAAYLRPNCILENNVSIGHGSEVKNSILFSESAVAHLNYIGDSIVGHDVNIGGGAKTANFRLDGKTIPVKNDAEKIDTGLTKFGAILGDRTKIGVNAVLNPGTVLGKEVHVYPLQLVFGTHSDGTVIK
jgi:bifunctional UDP-N-acetylglucosamine pyrophosphorylase / glucosamine-1-phosphate N-acetyltransferase